MVNALPLSEGGHERMRFPSEFYTREVLPIREKLLRTLNTGGRVEGEDIQAVDRINDRIRVIKREKPTRYQDDTDYLRLTRELREIADKVERVNTPSPVPPNGEAAEAA